MATKHSEDSQAQAQGDMQMRAQVAGVPYIVGHGAILMNLSDGPVSDGDVRFPRGVPVMVRPVTEAMQGMLDDKVLVIG